MEIDERMEKLREEIIELFKSYEVRLFCSIFCNGKKYHYYIDKLVETKEADVREYLEYCNTDTLSMSFDGDIYDIINYGDYPSCLTAFDNLLEKYGYYYEQGEAWNLSLYEL